MEDHQAIKEIVKLMGDQAELIIDLATLGGELEDRLENLKQAVASQNEAITNIIAAVRLLDQQIKDSRPQ